MPLANNFLLLLSLLLIATLIQSCLGVSNLSKPSLKCSSFFLILLKKFFNLLILENDAPLKKALRNTQLTNEQAEKSVLDLIDRVVGVYHSLNDFVVKINQTKNEAQLDKFEVYKFSFTFYYIHLS
jgi:hypothetical protein